MLCSGTFLYIIFLRRSLFVDEIKPLMMSTIKKKPIESTTSSVHSRKKERKFFSYSKYKNSFAKGKKIGMQFFYCDILSK
jgi:hypothetical protein